MCIVYLRLCIYILTSMNEKINRNGVKISISNVALKFLFSSVVRTTFIRSFVCCFGIVVVFFLFFFVIVALLLILLHIVRFVCVSLLLLLLQLKLMKNLLRSFIHFIMNNSYQIKHLAWCIIASADACNPFCIYNIQIHISMCDVFRVYSTKDRQTTHNQPFCAQNIRYCIYV